MNKAKYVDKMTDLVEDTLQSKGVSDDFTIVDNYEEEGEMSMTLSFDASGGEVTFDLRELYERKKEGDVKVKDQYAENFKERVEAFVDMELSNQRRERDQERNAAVRNQPFDAEDDYEDEEDYEDYDDYDDEEEDYEEDDYEDNEVASPLEEVLEDSEQSDAAPEEKPAISSAITGLFKPVEFVNINRDGSAKAASLPASMRDKTTEEIANRYLAQVRALYEGGAIVVHPNANDVVVFDAEKFGKDEVTEMLTDMLEEGGSKDIAEVEPERDEPGLP